MRVRIFQKSKCATQSGRFVKEKWVLEFERQEGKAYDYCMGWVGSCEPRGGMQLTFSSKESALSYARKNGYEATVSHSLYSKPIRRIRSYADNFSFHRVI